MESSEHVEIERTAPKVADYLEAIDYSENLHYVPSQFALDFVNLIKMINGPEAENKTPVVHYQMIDKFVQDPTLDTINMCHRGIAKSTLKEYLIFYLAIYGELPNLGKVPYALYVSDSIENGVKKMRKSLEFRWNNSDFLQEYIPTIKFTDLRWEFLNADGKSFVVSGYGAKTGVRGTRENNSRPVLALLDDLISDEDARSPAVIQAVEDVVYKAIDYALHPTRRKVIWSGTPFNAKDPLYKAVESGAWLVNVFPVCEKFPCTREEFRGSWPDRFTYDYVKRMYDKAAKSGKLDTFYQELMLQIMSEEERILDKSDIGWYSLTALTQNISNFNFYITTDFATSDKSAADFSVIFVWAVNHLGQYYWVDGIVKKQLMDANINDLFRLVQIYKPLAVGVEVTGQQQGFISWINNEMMNRNVFFPLASDKKSGEPGIRPTTNKRERFNVVLPLFKQKKIFLPKDLEHDPRIKEFVEELSLITLGEFKSKNDDCIDGVAMLGSMPIFLPAEGMQSSGGGMWAMDEKGEPKSRLDNYLV